MAEQLPNDFLAGEADIVDRLREALAAEKPAVAVLTSAELAKVTEATQPVPAVHVLWRGFRVAESRSDGAVARLDHTWAVVAAVRNVRTLTTGADARAAAGRLAALAGAALMGFRPRNVAGPMRLDGTLALSPSAAGYYYLPLTFRVESVFSR